ncbi:MAG: DUF1592 domain-containing protein [Polyangiaceae bacterium]
MTRAKSGGIRSFAAARSTALWLVLGGALCVTAAVAAGCGDDSPVGPGGAGGEGGGAPDPFELTPESGGIRRLTASQMRYSIEYLLGSQAALSFDVWVDQQLHGFESIAARELAVGANDVSTLETALGQSIDASLTDKSYVARFAPCVTTTADTACYGDFIDGFGRAAWRRPVEEDERARLLAIATDAQTWANGDFATGLRYAMLAIFQSPNFVYIAEVGEPDETTGFRKLTSYELASRMSFFLLHRTPDVELLDAVENGSLDTDDGIRAEARRMLALPEARRSLDRFFSELYFIRDLTDVSKDPTAYPQWNDELATAMQEEMLRFLQDIVWTRDADAREIFTSKDTFVNPLLAGIYGVNAPASGGWAKVTLDDSQGRAGLLGKAGFLARFAHPKLTSPTRRGRFFREKVLCREIPPPPPGVNQSLPEPTEPKTMRERIEAHALNDQCAGCHNLMDPIGLAYEHFDAMGLYRDKENGLDIDTAGKSGDLEFDDATDLAQLAADNGARCFVQNFWRQSMGHLETAGEEDAINLLEKSFEKGGYSLQDMMVELCTNPGFKTVGEPK